MKMHVLTDDKGNIGAVYAHSSSGKAAPSRSGIAAREGQRLHENVDVPDYLAAPDRIHELLKSHRIDVSQHEAKLVARK